MKRKDTSMLIDFKDLPENKRWAACKNALATEYTLTVKDMCKALMASRQWVDRYVLPHLHYIYLSNKDSFKAPYAEIATETHISCWYSKREFEELILKHITEIDRKTIEIPIEIIIENSRLNEFKDKKLNLDVEYNTGIIDYYEYNTKINELIDISITKNGRKILIPRPTAYKRSDTPAIKYSYTPDIWHLQSVHDKKDYGDTDEEVMRYFFRRGCARLVLTLPDDDGNTSQKVFYQVPDAVFTSYDESFEMTVEQSVLPIMVRYNLYVKNWFSF